MNDALPSAVGDVVRTLDELEVSARSWFEASPPFDADYFGAKRLAAAMVRMKCASLPYCRNVEPGVEISTERQVFIDRLDATLESLCPSFDRLVSAAFGTRPGEQTSVIKRLLLRLRDLARASRGSVFPDGQGAIDSLILLLELERLAAQLREWDWAAVEAALEWADYPEELITQERAAEIVRCDVRTIRRWLDEGKLSRHGTKVSKRELMAKHERLRERRPRTRARA